MQELLEFRCVRPLRTVHQLLQDAHGLALLSGAPCLLQHSCRTADVGLLGTCNQGLHCSIERHVLKPRPVKCCLKWAVSWECHRAAVGGRASRRVEA